MWTQLRQDDEHDLWSAVSGGPESGRRPRATGAEIETASSTSGLDLFGGWWPVVFPLHGALEATAELVERIETLIAEHGAAAVAARLNTLWIATDARVQFEVNNPTADGAIDEPLASAPSDPSHVQLARELRELTGLSAATLGAAVGVTREQYQRWLAGGAISGARHGQLIYLHTIAADVARRLGAAAGRLWWKTPVEGGTITAEELLRRRQADRVYRMVAATPDPAPIVDDVMRGLPVQEDAEYEDDLGGGGDSWSPYGDAHLPG